MSPFPRVAKKLGRAFVCVPGRTGMPAGLLQKVALRLPARRSVFPLGFGGQAGAGPAGEGIGLVVTEVGHRIVKAQGFPSVQRELGPALRFMEPGERSVGRGFHPPGPTVAQPEGGLRVAAVLDELEPLAIGHEPVGEREVGYHLPVSGPLIVVCEAVAVVPDLDRRTAELVPALLRSGACGRRCLGPKRGLQRAAPQNMLDVHEHQFLVLLFVVQSEFDDRLESRIEMFLKESIHTGINLVTVLHYIAEGRSGEKPASRARVLGSDQLVVGVEQHAVVLVHGLPAIPCLEYECLEEPGRVPEVPLRRADVRHGLDLHVLRGKCPGQGHCRCPRAGEAGGQVIPGRWRVHGDSLVDVDVDLLECIVPEDLADMRG